MHNHSSYIHTESMSFVISISQSIRRHYEIYSLTGLGILILLYKFLSPSNAGSWPWNVVSLYFAMISLTTSLFTIRGHLFGVISTS